ncbi:MAG: hypothetical protein HOY71_33695 [Nonomuraea sp.]|nr:hypothetical protein [Nonomuraea sp.]
MDVEAEILDIKLRIQALEATLSPEGVVMRSDKAEITADIADIRTEVSQNIAALGDELAGLRGQTDEHLEMVRSSIGRRLDLLLCETLDLATRIDRLLERDGA